MKYSVMTGYLEGFLLLIGASWLCMWFNDNVDIGEYIDLDVNEAV